MSVTSHVWTLSSLEAIVRSILPRGKKTETIVVTGSKTRNITFIKSFSFLLAEEDLCLYHGSETTFVFLMGVLARSLAVSSSKTHFWHERERTNPKEKEKKI